MQEEKKRVGRPLSANPKSKQYSLRFDEDTYEKLKTMSEETELTMGQIIRKAVNLLFAQEEAKKDA